MHDDIVLKILGETHQLTVEIDIVLRATASPSCLLIPDRYMTNFELMLGRQFMCSRNQYFFGHFSKSRYLVFLYLLKSRKLLCLLLDPISL